MALLYSWTFENVLPLHQLGIHSCCHRISCVQSEVTYFYVAVVILHASLRLRNVKNKIVGKVEYIGISRTPMGLVLEALGMEQEAAS